ncbi:MAG: hypothetical protein AB1758_38025, partial [Candidatus Eremiobacterota bacterium]
EAATAALEEARQAEQAGRQTLEECRGLKQRVDQRKAELAGLEETRTRAGELLCDQEARLAGLVPLQAELAGLTSEARTRKEQADAERARLEGERERLERSGRTRAHLARWQEAARLLIEREPELARLQSDLKPARTRVAEIAADVAELDEQLRVAASRREELVTQGKQAREEMDRARAELDGARLWLSQVRQLTRQIEEVAAQTSRESRQLKELQGKAERAEAKLRQCEADLASLQQERKDLEREQMAAALSAGCRPGDACPVCRRELQGDWEPPRAEALAGVTVQVEEAELKAREARDVHRDAVVALESGRAQAAERERQKAARQSELDELLKRSLDSALSDQEALAPVLQRVQAAEAAYEAMRTAFEQHKAEQAGRERTRSEQARALQEAGDRLRSMEEQASGLSARLDQARTTLAGALPPSPGLFDAAPEVDPVGLLGRLQAELSERDRLDRDAAAAVDQVLRLARELAELEDRSRRELEIPLRNLETELRDLRADLLRWFPDAPVDAPTQRGVRG